MVRPTILIGLGAALAIGVASSASAQGLVATRSNERVLFLIPIPDDGTDTSFVVQLADEVRERLRNKMRHKVVVLQSEPVCQVLEESGYQCDAILGGADAERLARAMQSDAFITGHVWHDGARPVGRFHIQDIGRSGLSGWTTVVGTPGDPPRAYAEAIVDTMDNQVRAGQYARECTDKIASGDFDDASERAERAFRMYENHPSAAMCAEVIAEATQQPVDSQIAYLERAVAGDSVLTRGWERLGRLYQQQGDSARSLEAFATQSRLDRTNRQLRIGVVAGAITVAQYEIARELAEEWLEVNPMDLGLLQLKARACVEGGLWDCALSAFAEQYEMDSSLVGDSVFYQQVIGAAQASSDTVATLRWTGEAITESPDVIPLWRAHASALAMAGMTDSVVTIYEHLLELDPTDYRSALAGSRIMLDDLPIDTITPLDTARLLKGIEFLNRATTATRDTNVLMNVAVTQYEKGSALVRARMEILVAIELLESAIQNDVREQLREPAHFFLAFGLILRIYEFDPQVTEAESCELVDEEALMISRGKEAIEIGASVSPATAEQFLQNFNNFEERIPTLRQAYECQTP